MAHHNAKYHQAVFVFPTIRINWKTLKCLIHYSCQICLATAVINEKKKIYIDRNKNLSINSQWFVGLNELTQKNPFGL